MPERSTIGQWSRATDGNFALPRSAVALPFAGEQEISDIGGIAFEQFHRYCFARDLCAGKEVLEVASGEGYGTALLAGVARRIVGVEINAAAVARARVAYPAANLEFVQAGATALPLADATFDVVVSFATLEHLRERCAFLTEIRRVLRPGGVLVVSAPDPEVYSAPGQPVKGSPVQEPAQPEFSALLSRFFAHHRILRQKPVAGSVMAPADPAARGGWRSYDRRAPGMLEATPGLSSAFCMIAIASDAPVEEPGSSVYSDTLPIGETIGSAASLRQFREEAARVLVEKERALTELPAEKAGLRSELLSQNILALREADADAAAELAERDHEIERLSEHLRHAAERNAAMAAELNAIMATSWWRIGAPVRRAGYKFPRAARLMRRSVRAVYWTLTGQIFAKLRLLREHRKRIAAVAAEVRAMPGFPDPSAAIPSAAEIRLPSPDYPVVSVIIPSFGQVDYTLRCLASIGRSPPRLPIEIIVVDDASGDRRVDELRAVKNLRLVVRTENLGFLRSCNDAARLARGRLLMFLNNDTVVMPGAIDTLAELLLARPDVGLAGARLMYPDGTQQEAGGIVWSDGSAWNYGHRDDPGKPEYNYVREVDYVSGAAIMLRREVWEEVDGFDDHFAPAYCEDSDLAFRLRAAGLRVLYHPEAVVIHYEGVSNGTDTSTGVKAHQVTNTAKLAARWRETLQREQLANGTRLMRARDRSLRRTVTLVIDHYVPQPDRDAGSRTILAFLDALIASGRVVKFFPANGLRTPGYTEALQRRGIEVQYFPASGLFAEWIAANGAEIDEVLVSRPSVAKEVLDSLAIHCRAPVVFYGHDLHYARMRLEPGADKNAVKSAAAAAMEADERQIWRSVDIVLYPSDEEASEVRRLEPRVVARSIPPYALPPPLPVRKTPPAATGGIVFVAGFAHPPNADAAQWFVGEVLPRIRAVYPGVPLTLAGSHPAKPVLALAGDGVTVTGYVTDEQLDQIYATARVAVCPLRFGAGVKLKVVEAMHHGIPLVTTPVGAQGLKGLDAVCDVTADANDFAAAVVRLLGDNALWLERAEAQSGYVASRFSPDAMRDALVAAFDAVRRHRRREIRELLPIAAG
jgi:GT2 family glycosyltransferase/ubiquinone/menaquinone biosynthesis C-methylase UbiE